MKRLVFVALALLAGCDLFGAYMRGEVPTNAEVIAKCQKIGLDCKADGGADCYGKYDDCMIEAGLR